MSYLRPECGSAPGKTAIPDETALFLIRDSIERRKELGYGALTDVHGRHCAIGAFFADNPKAVLHSSLIDEVAAVNDSIKPGPDQAKVRWRKVHSWIRFKLRVLAGLQPTAKPKVRRAA